MGTSSKGELTLNGINIDIDCSNEHSSSEKMLRSVPLRRSLYGFVSTLMELSFSVSR
jgi:hypothetical protein